MLHEKVETLNLKVKIFSKKVSTFRIWIEMVSVKDQNFSLMSGLLMQGEVRHPVMAGRLFGPVCRQSQVGEIKS